MKYIAYTVARLTAAGVKIKLYNIVSGAVTDLTDWINNDINSLSWSPNSQNILFDNGQVININTGIISTLFTMNQSYISSPRWSPDGKYVAFAGLVNNGWTNVYIYDLSTDSSRVLFPQEAFQFSATWSKDSKQLIFEQRPSGLAQTFLYKINLDGTNIVQITDSSDDNWFPCWYK